MEIGWKYIFLSREDEKSVGKVGKVGNGIKKWLCNAGLRFPT